MMHKKENIFENAFIRVCDVVNKLYLPIQRFCYTVDL